MKRTRVLVVEDMQRLRETLVTAIAAMDYPATGAASAEAALIIMERDPHEILVLDLLLPAMNGLDLFEKVRQRWPETQGIVLTGFGELDTARRSIHLDIVDFLTKPATLGDLEVAIDRAYRRRLCVVGDPPAEQRPEIRPTSIPAESPKSPLRDIERDHILAALERNGGDRNATAVELGISRRTLFYRLAEYRRETRVP